MIAFVVDSVVVRARWLTGRQRVRDVISSSRVARSLVACLVAIVLAILVPAVTAAQRPGSKPPQKKPPKSKLPAAVLALPTKPVMKVASLDRGTRPQVSKAAQAIDQILAAHWKAKDVTPSPSLSDQQFLRRVFLDLAGRIPSLREAQLFLQPPKRDREALVDYLLESPDYVSHFYNYWADILRLVDRPQRQLIFEPYLYYVKDSIRTNKPYDTWVHEMLSADGLLWENPAVGFQLRDSGMPLPYVDNTVRVFLGTQIGCAQCHDHPFDDWTQHQFYELAAFTSGTKNRGGVSTRELAQEARKELKQPTRFIQFLNANATSVSYKDTPLRLPHDYQYDDDKPKAVVTPHVLWGSVPTAQQNANRREQFASWVVSHDNRQFARTIANRLWKKIMGRGLVEPVDDFQAGNPAAISELLEHLTDEILRLNFDMREFIRILVSTDAYQRRAVVYDPASGVPFRFPAPALRRMTAEQLWDSIVTLVAYNAWAVQRPTTDEVAKAASVDVEKVSFESALKQYEQFDEAFGPGKQMRHLQKTVGYKGQLLVRASELPSPLPLGHFLRQFGQSDRESIEGSRTVATVPQILTMFNGPITHSMLERGSVIYDNVLASIPRGPDQVITVVFMSLLSRPPTLSERKLAREEISTAQTPAAGYGNLIWALLNTREFIFIQ